MTEKNVLIKSWADPITGACPVAEILRTLGGKHGPRILHCLTEGELHFLELTRAIDGISRKVLTDQLTALMRQPKSGIWCGRGEG